MPLSPALGGMHSAGGHLGLCYLHLGGQKPPPSALPRG